MQAVIMAGGKGTRLSKKVQNMPKAMALIDGKHLLEYQIENLKKSGIDRIILVIGYLGDIIQQYFSNGKKYGVHIDYFIEKTPLGTAGALSNILDILDDDFFFLFGDIFADIDYERFLSYHKNKNAKITLLAHPNDHPDDSDVIIVNQENLVTGWSSKKEKRDFDYENLVNSGLYIMKKSAIESIVKTKSTRLKDGDEFADQLDLEKDIIIPLIPQNQIYAYRSTEYAKDIGTPDRLERVKADYKNGICEKRNLKYTQKCIFLDRDGTINHYVNFVKRAEEIELEPHVAEAIRMINKSEYICIVITNQPVIARGECTFEEMNHIHNRLYTLLGNKKAYVDGLYFCPHHPDSGFKGEVQSLKFDCTCRKPKIGMLQQAKLDYNIALDRSWFIGDTNVDVQTGINAGTHTVLLKSGDSNKNRGNYYEHADILAENLLDAVEKILAYKGD